jgi:geranylgeranyl reductase family protein
MDRCDVLIVGGGPAGSACARRLVQAGLDTVILDRSKFPREKLCGGWITPGVVQDLELDPADYERGRTFQPITGFRTSRMRDPEVETDYGRPISFGILRKEFDDYLLKRSGARLLEGMPLAKLARDNGGWVANDEIRARMVIGAGGHFCPVARFLGADARKETAVAAQEVEFEMTPEQRERCSVRGELPELYFCADMRGYGWCFRKGTFLNIGLGRLDSHSLRAHVTDFAEFLKSSGKIGFDLPVPMRGHAYLIYAKTNRKIVDDAILLAGDAAGLAYSQSGEGIRPAIESGLFSAEAVIGAKGIYTREKLQAYPKMLADRYGKSNSDWSTRIGRRLPQGWMHAIARSLLATRWFSRHYVLDRWFLHAT